MPQAAGILAKVGTRDLGAAFSAKAPGAQLGTISIELQTNVHANCKSRTRCYIPFESRVGSCYTHVMFIPACGATHAPGSQSNECVYRLPADGETEEFVSSFSKNGALSVARTFLSSGAASKL